MGPSDEAIVFCHGVLRDPVLRRIVLSTEDEGVPALLRGRAYRGTPQDADPVPVIDAAAEIEGLLLSLGAEDLARGAFYGAIFGYVPEEVSVVAEGRTRRALTWWPETPREGATSDVWSFDVWQGQGAALARAAAEDAMVMFGERTAVAIKRRWPQMLARAQARLNAEAPTPTELRRPMHREDVEILGRRTPYAAFFSVEEYELRHMRFAGRMSEPMVRAAFVSGDAVTVLPYDPTRDRVLLIEQFRAGPLARGDAQCWSLEAIAGRIDGGETPEETARREAHEEAGLHVDSLIPISSYYPTPGAKSEFLYSYLAVADLPDAAAGLGGLAEEHEDIRSHIVSFDRLMELVASGEVNNAPLLISAFALRAQRADLREARAKTS